ncbi:NAD-dependent dihydropyrimidine dehydrogenase subunit PreA [Acidiplasma aeolicum]|jgi:dihydropyrimidine dehydrogenase (NAD+) subunit PreA|uniref:NAD-dependent dihydropyrimidine dehydrogenase subunit PreA n=1 Tax=Acidiplasma aeolicum TaxID=507754 RepID=UPI000A03AC9B|nr:NAD-dependent dihydropyrimidine dehydrogenase subunit PreA [Acidiplasma aeolicum]
MQENDSLEIDFDGVKFKNPFWVGSGPTSGTADKIIQALKAGWGGVVIKTVGDSIVRKGVRPMYAAMRDQNKDLVVFENIELITEDNLETWDRYIRTVYHEIPDAPIIFSIMGSADISEWAKLARWSEDRGANLIELNFGCPHGEPEKRSGAYISQHPDLVYEYTKEVVQSVGVPVIAKLSPNVTEITEIAKNAERAGAKAVSAINTVSCLMGVDIEREMLFPPVFGYTTYGGLSGPGVKPIGLKAVSSIYNNTKLTISGIGGISNWTNAVEYIMCGATSVQVVTDTIMHGFNQIKEWTSSMADYLKRHNYDSLDDIRGKLAGKIKEYSYLENLISERDSIDDELRKIREV